MCNMKSPRTRRPHLIILEPGEALSREDEPVLLGSALHNADVVDGQPALPYNLQSSQGWGAQRQQEGHDRHNSLKVLGKLGNSDSAFSKEWPEDHMNFQARKQEAAVRKWRNFEKRHLQPKHSWGIKKSRVSPLKYFTEYKWRKRWSDISTNERSVNRNTKHVSKNGKRDQQRRTITRQKKSISYY